MTFEVPNGGQEERPTFEEWDRQETGYKKETSSPAFLWDKVAQLFDDPNVVAALNAINEEKIAALEQVGASNQAEVVRALKKIEAAAIDARAARRERYEERYPSPEAAER
jgi:hypothetical protein